MIIEPIGHVRSGMKSKFSAPHQPKGDSSEQAEIELLPGKLFEQALEDLSGFEMIWVISWMHRNNSWRPKVRPPRGQARKRGVFATRSPHRPNPIAISAVPLLSVSRRKLVIGACDLVDGTPVLDIKPYIPKTDSFPKARTGWLEEVEESWQPRYRVTLSEEASLQLAWLEERGVNFFERARRTLEIDPSEHKTRRIKRHGENLFRMGCAEWRVFFSVTEEEVQVRFIRPGYDRTLLESPGRETIPHWEEQLQFMELWS
jgi:tRNA-Thr(GGU) m(6)t(6)A37 methyltransferase TsaA